MFAHLHRQNCDARVEPREVKAATKNVEGLILLARVIAEPPADAAHGLANEQNNQRQVHKKEMAFDTVPLFFRYRLRICEEELFSLVGECEDEQK